jgi:hypothetical protein
MQWSGRLKRTRQYFNKHFHPLLKFRPAFAKNASRRPNNPLFPRATGHNSSSTTKGSATASLLVSLAGLLIWSAESNSRSNNERALGKHALLRDSPLGSSPRRTESGAINPPSSIAFTYLRLSEGETTRILILEPGEFDDDLKGHLKHVRSLQDHDYEALSYVWGETSVTHTVSSSDMKIQITANLDAALRRLRLPGQPRLLWVDAICINQDDIIERSRQVRIMREIYANAKQVVVWLGEAKDNDALAFKSLLRLRVRLSIQEDSWFLIRLGWYRDKNDKVFSGGAHRSMLSDIEYDHLINLLCREWFRRTWVIQEVASARSAIIVCGEESMRWETFADIYMRLGDQFLPVSQFGGEFAQHSLENIAAIETARRSHSGPLSMSLFHILVATSFSKCKDQRDKIFAVVGLAKDWLETRVLIPDYDTREEKALEVFKEFAIADSNQNGDLRALSCASRPSVSGNPPLPSWVPDWRNIENAHPFVRYSDRTKFAASGGMKAVAWHSNNQRILHVTGKLVDSIALLGSEPKFTKAIAVFQINHKKIEELQHSWKWLQECRELASDENGILTAERYEELWRTMTCGLTGDAFPAPKRYSVYFVKYMNFMASASQRFNDYLIESETTVNGVRGLDEVIPHFETHAIIEASLHRWSSRRRFCTTTNGRLACVPKNSHERDVICILFGGEVPYVLRPIRAGYYSVIGECYVDNIMHGESLSHDTMPREFQLK